MKKTYMKNRTDLKFCSIATTLHTENLLAFYFSSRLLFKAENVQIKSLKLFLFPWITFMETTHYLSYSFFFLDESNNFSLNPNLNTENSLLQL